MVHQVYFELHWFIRQCGKQYDIVGEFVTKKFWSL